MPGLLVIHHSPTTATRVLLDAVLDGSHDPALEGVDVRDVPALEVTADDVLAADGYILGTPANFGNMETKEPSGLACLKHDRPNTDSELPSQHVRHGSPH